MGDWGLGVSELKEAAVFACPNSEADINELVKLLALKSSKPSEKHIPVKNNGSIKVAPSVGLKDTSTVPEWYAQMDFNYQRWLANEIRQWEKKGFCSSDGLAGMSKV